MLRTIDTIHIGDSASVSKTVTGTDVYLFAGITGALNPAHVNHEVSSKTMFKGRIAHSMLSAGFISAVLGMYLPGPGTIYLGQELKFTKPLKFRDTVTVTVVDKLDDWRASASTRTETWSSRAWLP